MGIYDRPYYRDSSSPDLAPSWDQRSGVTLLILACVAVFLANLIFTARTDAIQKFLSLHSDDWARPWMLWRTLAYGFVHSPERPMHILFNMFELWMLGRAVEDRYGKGEFIRIFIVAVVVCGLGWLALRIIAGDYAMLCGASGAVCCSTMLYVLNYPRTTLLLFGVIPIQAWMLGAFLIVSNLLSQGSAGLTTLRPGQGPAVAFDVHLIGIAFACAYFYGGWNLAALSRPWSSIKSWRRRLTAPRLKAYRPAEDSTSKDEAEADRLLDKIHQFGQDSLTSKEKRFLAEYSQRVRKKREGS